MLVYLLGWATIYFAKILETIFRYRGRAFIIICLAALALIAFFRGRTGSDTISYEEILYNISSNNDNWNGMEPFFFITASLLAQSMPSIEIAVRSFSLFFFGLLIWFVWRSDHNERDLLIFYLLPAYAYNYSMNTLRAGLAFCFVLLMAQSIRLATKKKEYFFAVLALNFHYSSLLPIVYLNLINRSLAKINTLAWKLFAIACTVIIFFLAEDYFISKLILYQSSVSPSKLSGLSSVIPILMILLGTAFGRLPFGEKFKIIFFGISVLTLSWTLSRYSYSGLRLLDLFGYATPLSILMAYARHGMRFEKFMIFSLFLAGLVSIAFWSYRVLNESNDVPVPWLPYETWFAL